MTTPNYKQTPLRNNRSIKIRFAYRFLRSLKKLNRYRLTTARRCYMVKFASYASMASAVGSRKAWSRAMLRKIKNHQRLIIPSLLKPCKTTRNPSNEAIISNKRNPSCESGFVQGAEEVRKLVPGGETMDFCNLLDETAHYIECLNSQVQIMRNILDFYSV